MLVQVVLLANAVPVAAEPRIAVLTGPRDNASLNGLFDYYLDPEWLMTAAELHGRESDRFSPYPSRDPDFGYTDSRIWLRLAVRNDTTDQSDWRLYLHENFKQVFDVYVARAEGQIENPLSLNPDSPFSDRPIRFPEMVAPLRIAPGESVTLYLAYWSEGSSYLGLSIETVDSFAEAAGRKTAKNFVFYGMMLLLILAALASLAVLHHPVFLAYAAYAGSALLYVMHADGVTFQYLWPTLAGFNSLASVATGTGIIVFGAIYARVFLKTAQHHPIMDICLLGVIVVTLGLNIALLAIDPQLLKKLLVGMSLLAVICFAVAGGIAARKRFREVRFYLLAWGGAVVSAAMLNMRHIFGLEISQETLHDSMRVVMVFDAVMMGLAIADGFNQIRLSRQQALQTSLSETRRNLDLNQRLNDLEKRFVMATDLARSRDVQIQNTVHDLRQPLHALRLTVEARISAPDTTAHDTVEKTFDYLERLIAEQLDATVSPDEGSPDDPTTDARPDLSAVLASIRDMFEPDATAKGLRLRLVEHDLDVDVPPLVLMRVVSNLVANAIRYTARGGVLLGARRRDGAVLIEVHDTGPGLTAAEFDAARRRHVRLDQGRQLSEGHGLGLAIAEDLARKHGLTLGLSRMRRSGTGVVLAIPVGSVTESRTAQ